MYTFSFQQIADHIQLARDTGREDLDIEGFPLDHEDSLAEQIEYYFSEAREATIVELADRGLIIDRDSHLVTVSSPVAMGLAYSLINQIAWEYDCTKIGPTTWWDDLGLGGDDDVDYNSSYLWTVFDIIDDMLPEGYNLPDPDALTADEYQLLPEELKAQVDTYMKKFYENNPDRKVSEDLRARVHALLPAGDGLSLTDTEFQLYRTVPDKCLMYRAPRSDTGPWVFTHEGYDNIIISED